MSFIFVKFMLFNVVIRDIVRQGSQQFYMRIKVLIKFVPVLIKMNV